MSSGAPGRALASLLAALCATLAALLVAFASPAFAGGAEARPGGLPTAAALQRATRKLLREPPYRRARAGELRAEEPAPAAGAILPDQRVVTLYGAPQLSATALGKRTPAAAARKVVRQAEPYARLGEREVVPGFDLIGVVATASAGADGLYRTRQPDEVIAQYLEQARAIGGRLVLDIQPGRSPVLDELAALEPWIRQPDVDVAIDPEWNVGPAGVPGRTRGRIGARAVNAVSRRLQAIVEEDGLPPKLLIVHQFRRTSVRHRRRIRQREDVSATLNFDGIGSPAAKEAGYVGLARAGLFNGFSLFYDLDAGLMSPRSVLALVPAVDFLLYQ